MAAIFNSLRQMFQPSAPDPVSVATVLARENNNFDLLRLLAASAVILGHSYAISPLPGYMDPVQQLVHFDYSGGIAVALFFFLSGLMVTDSIRRQPSVPRFLLARGARILPGLFVCLLVTGVVVGPLFTTFRLSDYIRQPETLSYYYKNLALTDMQWRLPGVFAESPWGLNGSLWTLPVEVRLYLTVAGLGLLRVWGPRWSAHACLGALLLWGWVWPAHFPYFLHNAALLPPVLSFVAGTFAAINKDRIPIRGDWALAIAVAGMVSVRFFPPACYVGLFYLALYVFQTRPLRRMRLPGDYSYGVYIYGFVIQQCVGSLQRVPNPHVNLLISLPLTLGAGMLSWHLVELPTLGLFKRLPSATGSLRAFFRTDAAGAARTVLFCLALPCAGLALPLAIRLLPGYGQTLQTASDLQITAFGPEMVAAGQVFNRQPNGEAAIWVKVSRPLDPQAQISLGGILLKSNVADQNTITAFVPKRLYAAPRSLPLYITEPTRQGVALSNTVKLVVRNSLPAASGPASPPK